MFELSIQWLELELEKAIAESRFSDMEFIEYILLQLQKRSQL